MVNMVSNSPTLRKKLVKDLERARQKTQTKEAEQVRAVIIDTLSHGFMGWIAIGAFLNEWNLLLIPGFGCVRYLTMDFLDFLAGLVHSVIRRRK